MKCIFDIGMFDGADTAYYLEMGYRVVAVEANPSLVQAAAVKFKEHIDAGRLVIVEAAISADGGPVELQLASADLGSSSIFADRISNKRPAGAHLANGVTVKGLFDSHGVPEFIKVDIEGADRFCILQLTPETCPKYVSFEFGNDGEELIEHLRGVGCQRFKLINQISFRELSNIDNLPDRLAARAMLWMGYREPRLIRRAGRYFVSGHSSGPVPWLSDGQWKSGEAFLAEIRSSKLRGWNDVLATR